MHFTARAPRAPVVQAAKDVLLQATRGWFEHDASSMGAALAFYTLFSFAPILIVATGVAGWIVGGEAVRADLGVQARTLLGNSAAAALETLLSSMGHLGKSRAAIAIGVGTLLLGASTVFVELQTSLDRIYGVPKRNRQRGLWRFARSRFLSLGLVFAVGFLLMVSLMVSTILAAVGGWLASYLGEWRVLLLAIDVSLSVVVTSGLFALVYKYVPQEGMKWIDVWLGAAVAAVLFNIGKFAIGYYLGKSAFASVYGAAGSLLVLLLWSYYSAQIFLFGAEIIKSCSLIRRPCAASQSWILDESR